MAYKYNPWTCTLDAVLTLENPLQFKGNITVNSDFPTSALVQSGWYYTVGATVTDDDPTKTNTGQSFISGDEIAWNGSNWSLLGNGALYVPYTGATSNVNLGTHDLTTTGDITAGNLNISNWNDAYDKRVDTWTAPLDYTTQTVSISKSDASTDGYLSSTDWNAFNNKVTESTSVSDTNTINLTLTTYDITGDVKYQNTTTIDLSEDASGLKADLNSTLKSNYDDAYDKRVDTWGDGLQYSSQTASVDYNTTNLKITSTELNTIQDIDTTATPQFSGLTLTGDLTTEYAIGRDSDNELAWTTDDQLDITISGSTTQIASISTGTSDNDKLVTQGYVDDAVEGENLWDRDGTTLEPHTANDSIDIGSGDFDTTGTITGANVTSGSDPGHTHTHNLTTSLQGGTTDEYYHLKEEEYTWLTNTSSQTVYVDGTRTDDYTEDGSISKPFKTIKAAYASITDAGSDNRYTVKVATAVYVEQNPIPIKHYVFTQGDFKHNPRIEAADDDEPLFEYQDNPGSSGYSTCDWGEITFKAPANNAIFSATTGTPKPITGVYFCLFIGNGANSEAFHNEADVSGFHLVECMAYGTWGKFANLVGGNWLDFGMQVHEGTTMANYVYSTGAADIDVSFLTAKSGTYTLFIYGNNASNKIRLSNVIVKDDTKFIQLIDGSLKITGSESNGPVDIDGGELDLSNCEIDVTDGSTITLNTTGAVNIVNNQLRNTGAYNTIEIGAVPSTAKLINNSFVTGGTYSAYSSVAVDCIINGNVFDGGVNSNIVDSSTNLRAVPTIYSTIQEGSNAASSGDIVTIAPGTYSERLTAKAGVKYLGLDYKTTIIDYEEDTLVFADEGERLWFEQLTFMCNRGNTLVSMADIPIFRSCTFEHNGVGSGTIEIDFASLTNTSILNFIDCEIKANVNLIGPGTSVVKATFTDCYTWNINWSSAGHGSGDLNLDGTQVDGGTVTYAGESTLVIKGRSNLWSEEAEALIINSSPTWVQIYDSSIAGYEEAILFNDVPTNLRITNSGLFTNNATYSVNVVAGKTISDALISGNVMDTEMGGAGTLGYEGINTLIGSGNINEGDLDVQGDLSVSGDITGTNVTSGEDPGHTHTTSSVSGFLKLDCSNDPLTDDLGIEGDLTAENGVFNQGNLALRTSDDFVNFRMQHWEEFGNTDGVGMFFDDENGLSITNYDGDIYFSGGREGTLKTGVSIRGDTGRVGIGDGMWDPQYALDCVGDMNIPTGSVYRINGVTHGHDSSYLKLDTSNDPLTGNLEISKITPEIKWTDTGNSEYSRILRSDTSNKFTAYNRINTPSSSSYALDFNGSGDYLDLTTDPFNTNAGTIIMWIKPATLTDTKPGTRGNLLESWVGTGDLSYIGLHTDGKIYFGEYNGDGVNGGSVSTGSWHLIVCSWDASDYYLYIDGSEIESGGSGTFVHGIGQRRIGHPLSSASDFDGDISEIAIWSRALTTDEKNDLWNSGSGLSVTFAGSFPSTSTAMSDSIDIIYNLNENTGTIATDTSGNSWNGAISGADWTSGFVFLGSISEIEVWSSQDAIDGGITGINTFGVIGGYTIINGSQITINGDVDLLGQQEITSTSDPQLKLIHTDGVDETDFYTDSDGYLTVTPTGAKTTITGDLVVTGTASVVGFTKNIVTKTGAYTTTTSDDIILCDGTWTLTLIACSGNTGKIYNIKNINTGTITVDGNASETIDGELTVELIQDEAITIATDGSNWYIL